MSSRTFDRQTLRDILQWDVLSWKRTLAFWETCLGEVAGARVLDIGARDGGLSLYWTLRGCQVVCSDLTGPTPAARQLHQRYGVADRVEYAQANATSLAFRDGEFDIVSFKSVLGGIGGAMGFEGQAKGIREMHRVLRAGGRLAFAENLTASPLHQFLRKQFVAWGERWRYVALGELPELFSPFASLDTAFYGFFATFGRREWQRNLLHGLDVMTNPFIPDRYKYICFGLAKK